MNVLVFVVCTAFGSNTLAFVQHHVAVQPNSIVGCNRFDANKHCIDGYKVLSSRSNKSLTLSSVHNGLNKVSTDCIPV